MFATKKGKESATYTFSSHYMQNCRFWLASPIEIGRLHDTETTGDRTEQSLIRLDCSKTKIMKQNTDQAQLPKKTHIFYRMKTRVDRETGLPSTYRAGAEAEWSSFDEWLPTCCGVRCTRISCTAPLRALKGSVPFPLHEFVHAWHYSTSAARMSVV